MESVKTHASLLAALSSDNRASLRGLFQPNSPSGRAIVAQHLLDAEGELGDYDINIAILLAKRQRLVRQIERCKSLLAPINKIPPEILCSIFEGYCKKNHLSCPPIAAEALTVSAVCHRWRQIVLSAPELWSSLHIDVSHWIHDRHRLPYITQVFTERSQMCPLQICLVWYRRAYSRNFDRQFIAQLEEICLELSYLNLGSEGVVIPDDVFADAPSLSSVIYSPKPDPATAKFPFEQLKFLELRECRSADATSALKCCINLEKLELCNVGDNLDGDVSRVTLPNVKVLKVMVKKKRNISFVFRHLALPQLTSMEIRGCKLNIEEPTWSDLDDLTAICRFFHESSCNITTMRLCELPVLPQVDLASSHIHPNTPNTLYQRFTPTDSEEQDCHPGFPPAPDGER
ncbi:hypothetical protein WG66_009113 [Moniliophthora roreri]|uniref:F-box domain-containing protein n=1 Tax=Moniliophthora roreri TaxID=221103 RepID=A0A0W0F878_MONRR|nr:hypothetical protein WG66_009113 [Moniliophthora roreri]